MFDPQLERAYSDSRGHHDNLKTHLQDTAANSRKINQTMEHYGYMSCTLTLLADRLRACREKATADLKKVRMGGKLGRVAGRPGGMGGSCGVGRSSCTQLHSLSLSRL